MTTHIVEFRCKTPGCTGWIDYTDFEDSFHTKHVPINIGADPVKRACPDCGQVHEYCLSEKMGDQLVPRAAS